MNEKQIREISQLLIESLVYNLKDFLKKHSDIDSKTRFLIVSISMSTFISTIVHNLFVDEASIEHLNSYIDDICEMAKKRLIQTRSFVVKEV